MHHIQTAHAIYSQNRKDRLYLTIKLENVSRLQAFYRTWAERNIIMNARKMLIFNDFEDRQQ